MNIKKIDETFAFILETLSKLNDDKIDDKYTEIVLSLYNAGRCVHEKQDSTCDGLICKRLYEFFNTYNDKTSKIGSLARKIGNLLKIGSKAYPKSIT
jgi:hypothetical protein